MVTTAAQDDAPAPRLRGELLRAATWRAARWGVEERLVDVGTARLAPAWEVIDGLVDSVGEALRDAGDAPVVAEGLARIRARGTGARRQREAYAAGGIAGLVDALAELTLRS